MVLGRQLLLFALHGPVKPKPHSSARSLAALDSRSLSVMRSVSFCYRVEMVTKTGGDDAVSFCPALLYVSREMPLCTFRQPTKSGHGEQKSGCFQAVINIGGLARPSQARPSQAKPSQAKPGQGDFVQWKGLRRRRSIIEKGGFADTRRKWPSNVWRGELES